MVTSHFKKQFGQRGHGEQALRLGRAEWERATHNKEDSKTNAEGICDV